NGGKFYAADLVDQIAGAYSAVSDILRLIEHESDADRSADLAAKALLLYKHAVRREEMIVSELEKKTGKIQVLIDTSKGYGGYDYPVMGFVIHSKEEASHEE